MLDQVSMIKISKRIYKINFKNCIWKKEMPQYYIIKLRKTLLSEVLK